MRYGEDRIYLVLTNGKKIATTIYNNRLKNLGMITYSIDGISISFDIKFGKYKFKYSTQEIKKKVYPKFTDYRIKKMIRKKILHQPQLKRKETSYAIS